MSFHSTYCQPFTRDSNSKFRQIRSNLIKKRCLAKIAHWTWSLNSAHKIWTNILYVSLAWHVMLDADFQREKVFMAHSRFLLQLPHMTLLWSIYTKCVTPNKTMNNNDIAKLLCWVFVSVPMLGCLSAMSLAIKSTQTTKKKHCDVSISITTFSLLMTHPSHVLLHLVQHLA